MKRLVGPVQCLASGLDFLGAQRRTMHFFGTGSMGRALADDRTAANKRGTAAFRCKLLGLDDSRIDRAGAVTVDTAHDVPAVAFETLGRIVAKPVLHGTVNGNAVVVVEHNELGQLERPGQ